MWEKLYGGVAELAYATDLKSVPIQDCGFKSHRPHDSVAELVYAVGSNPAVIDMWVQIPPELLLAYVDLGK